MKLGEKARLDITSDFAYGSQEFPGLIPPHSDLILYVLHACVRVRLVPTSTNTRAARSSSRRSTKRLFLCMAETCIWLDMMLSGEGGCYTRPGFLVRTIVSRHSRAPPAANSLTHDRSN
jgi:hypothetical protein